MSSPHPALYALVLAFGLGAASGCGQASQTLSTNDSGTYAARSLVSTTVSSPVDFSIARGPSHVESEGCDDADVTITRRTSDVTKIESPIIGKIVNGRIRLDIKSPGDYTLRYLAAKPCRFKVYEPVADAKP